MPLVEYKNKRFEIPDTIEGVPFVDLTPESRLNFFNQVEEKNPGIFADAIPEPLMQEEPEEDVGFFRGIGTALGRGANQLTTGLAVTANRAGLLSDEATAEQVAQDIEDMKKYPQSGSIKSGLQEIHEAEGFGESALAVVTNPGAVFDVAVQSLVSSVPSLVGMFAGGAAGAAVGNVPGAIAGAATGAGLGSYGVEWAATVVDEMRKEGVDLNNVREVQDFLANDLKMQKAGSYAEKRAVPIGAFDAITAGVAGRLLAPVSKAVAGKALTETAEQAGREAGQKAQGLAFNNAMLRGFSEEQAEKIAAKAYASASRTVTAKKLGKVGFGAGLGAELVTQAVGGGAGEASAQIVSEGRITTPGEVLLEMFAELPTALAETAIGVRAVEKNNAKLRKAGILDEDVASHTYMNLQKPNDRAPTGTVAQQSFQYANLYTNDFNDAVLNFDTNQNIVTETDSQSIQRTANSIIAANIEFIESSDQASVVKNDDGSFSLVMDFGRLTNLKFNNENQANTVAGTINANIPSAVEAKNKNIDRVNALWAARKARQAENKQKRATAKEKNKLKEFQRETKLSETLDSITEEEIQQQLSNQKVSITADQLAKAHKSVKESGSFSVGRLRKELGLGKDFKEVTSELKTQLQNRGVIGAGQNPKYLKAFSKTPEFRQRAFENVADEGIKEAIRQQKELAKRQSIVKVTPEKVKNQDTEIKVEENQDTDNTEKQTDEIVEENVPQDKKAEVKVKKQSKKIDQQPEIVEEDNQDIANAANDAVADAEANVKKEETSPPPVDTRPVSGPQPQQDAVKDVKKAKDNYKNLEKQKKIKKNEAKKTRENNRDNQAKNEIKKAVGYKKKKQNQIKKAEEERFYHEAFVQNFDRDFVDDIRNRLQAMAGINSDALSFGFVDKLENGASAIMIADEGKFIVKIAGAGLEGKTIPEAENLIAQMIQEEGFHIITYLAERGIGPLSKGQLQSLKKWVKKPTSINPATNKTWYNQILTDPNYGKRGASIEEITDEAMAAAYVAYVNNRIGNKNKEVFEADKFFNPIKKYFNAFYQVLKGRDLTVDELFGNISDVQEQQNPDSQLTPEQIIEGEKDFFMDYYIPTAKQEAEYIQEFERVEDFQKVGKNLGRISRIRNSFITKTDTINHIENDSRNPDGTFKTSPEARQAGVDAVEKMDVDKTPTVQLTQENKRFRRFSFINTENNKSDQEKFFEETVLGPINQSTPDTGVTVIQLLSKGSWTEAIQTAAQTARQAFVNDLDYLTLQEGQVAKKNQGELYADVSAHVAAQWAKNSAAQTKNAFTIGPPAYSTRDQGGIGLTTNRAFDMTITDNNNNTETITVRGLLLAGQEGVFGDILSADQKNGESADSILRSFSAYLVAKRELSLRQSDDPLIQNRVFLTSKQQAQKEVARYEKKYPDFNVTSQKLKGYLDQLTEFKRNTGLITQEQYQAYKDYDFYIPFFRRNMDQKRIAAAKDNILDQEDVVANATYENGKLKLESLEKKFKKTAGYEFRIVINGEYADRSFKSRSGVESYLNTLLKENPGVDVSTIKVIRKEPAVGNLLNNLLLNISETIEEGNKNVAHQRIIRDSLKLNTAVRLRDDTQDMAGTEARARNENWNMSLKIDGVTQYFYVHDPMLFKTLEAMNEPAAIADNLLNKTLVAPANVLRELVTRDPGFMLANMLRDSLSAYITSGRMGKPIVDSLNGLMSAINKDPEAAALISAGIKGGFDWGRTGDSPIAKEIQKEIKKLYPKNKGVMQKGVTPLKFLWEKLEKGTENSDLATRIAVYNDVLARTGNQAQALWEAQEVLNFRRRGRYMKLVSASIPFLNARIQGLDVLYRGFTGNAASGATLPREQIKRLAIVRGSYLMAFTSLLWLMQSGDDEYELIDDSVRDNNWIILGKYFGKPDTFIKIPIPFEVGLMFKTVPDRVLSAALGTDTNADLARSMKQAVFGTLQFGPPTAISPIVENLINYNFLSGRSILNPYEQTDVDPRLVTRTGTSELAQKTADILSAAGLGGVGILGANTPVEIDNLIRGYTGTLGSYLVTLLDSALPTDITKPSRHLEDYPVVSRVLGELRSARGVTGEIYQLRDQVRKATNSIKGWETRGNFDRVEEILERDIGLLSNQEAINQSLKKIQDINRALRTLRFQGSFGLTQEEIDNERDILEEERRLEGIRVKDIKQNIRLYE